jgi:hypothetical protein
MDFIPVVDDETRLSLTCALWQEGGTGDAFVSVGMLLGLHVGNEGGASGAMSDSAGGRFVIQ